MKKVLLFFLPVFFSLSCSDEAKRDAMASNSLSAKIDSASWKATGVYTRHSFSQEGGPLTLVGSGDEYTIEITLGGITGEGEYDMGASRIGKIMYGNNIYSTLDVTNAGKITITSFTKGRMEGSFFFDAQLFSANNIIRVSDGKFEVTYY